MITNFIKNISQKTIEYFDELTFCLDLGSSITRLGIKNKGIVVREPSCLSYNLKTKNYLSFGEEAKSIIGKTPEFIKVIKPIVFGVISDFDASVFFLNEIINKYLSSYLKKKFFFRPPMKIIASITRNATEIERKALEELLNKVGFSQIFLLESPIAASVFIKNDLFVHSPFILVDIGFGLTEISVISGGGVVVDRILKVGGGYFLQQISNYLYLKYGIILGENSLELLLKTLLNFTQEEKTYLVRGKSLENGLPKSVKIKSYDIKEALIPSFNTILDAIKEVIEIAPPETLDEIYKNGIYLIGGIANIKGIDKFFADTLKIEVVAVERPENCVITGLLKLSQNPIVLKKLLK